MSFLDRIPATKHDIVRAAFVASVLASPDQEDAATCLREMRIRELGPDWLRQLCRDHALEAQHLMARTISWCVRAGNRGERHDEQRRLWQARCAAGITVADVARRAGVSCRWAHQVEQGEVTATKAQMLPLWAAVREGE